MIKQPTNTVHLTWRRLFHVKYFLGENILCVLQCCFSLEKRVKVKHFQSGEGEENDKKIIILLVSIPSSPSASSLLFLGAQNLTIEKRSASLHSPLQVNFPRLSI